MFLPQRRSLPNPLPYTMSRMPNVMDSAPRERRLRRAQAPGAHKWRKTTSPSEGRIGPLAPPRPARQILARA